MPTPHAVHSLEPALALYVPASHGSHAAGPPPRGLYTYEVDQDAAAKGKLRILAGRLPTLQEPT